MLYIFYLNDKLFCIYISLILYFNIEQKTWLLFIMVPLALRSNRTFENVLKQISFKLILLDCFDVLILKINFKK